MLKVLVTLTAVVVAAPSWACGVFTLENRPPGERMATLLTDDRAMTIEEAGEAETYDLRSAGTGLPYEVGYSRIGGEDIEVLEHKGDLIVNSMVYVPFCTKGGRLPAVQ